MVENKSLKLENAALKQQIKALESELKREKSVQFTRQEDMAQSQERQMSKHQTMLSTNTKLQWLPVKNFKFWTVILPQILLLGVQ